MVEVFRKLTIALLLVVWFFPGAGPAHGSEAQRGQARVPALATSIAPGVSAGGVPGTAADVERLAQRERQARSLEQFEGGRIGAATLIIILLLIIIIILLI